jgi:hypothetical protein
VTEPGLPEFALVRSYNNFARIGPFLRYRQATETAWSPGHFEGTHQSDFGKAEVYLLVGLNFPHAAAIIYSRASPPELSPFG